MAQYGVFDDDKLVKGGFPSLADAVQAADLMRVKHHYRKSFFPARLCPDHPGQDYDACKKCPR